MTGLRLYGIVRADAELPTVPSVELGKVVSRDIAAVVSGPDERELTEDDATTHLDVLCALVLDSPVLPLRFGTVAPDADAVVDEVLDVRHEEFAAMLDAVAGLVELRVEFEFDEPRLLRELVADEPDLRGGEPGDLSARVEFGQAVVERLTEHTRAHGDELVEPLLRVASKGQRLDSNEPTNDRWALLVPATEVSTVDEMVAEVRSRARDAEVTYTGPLPVFTFLSDLPNATGPETEARKPTSAWGW